MKRKEITLIIQGPYLHLKIEDKVIVDNKMLRLHFRLKNLLMIYIWIQIETIKSKLEV